VFNKLWWHNSVRVLILLQVLLSVGVGAESDTDKLIVPIVVEGRTQVVPEFEDPDLWIRHDLWVETEFDSDGDGKPDRMHVDVTRPRQTDDGLKLPVIYENSPYFGGVGSADSEYLWDVRHELGG